MKFVLELDEKLMIKYIFYLKSKFLRKLKL